MKGFERENQRLSLCGLNCGLCVMRIGDYCPGCGGGAGNQGCAVARCGMAHGVQYCFECPEYPCQRYDGCDECDSFITYRNRRADLDKAARAGIAAYIAEQERKAALLLQLLAEYNDGRRKRFYCLAVNLLEEEDVRSALRACEALPPGERAGAMAERLKEAGAARGVELKLRKNRKEGK